MANPSAETDREALVAFFNASNGEEWDVSGTWAGYTPLEKWKGVRTNNEGRVVSMGVDGGAVWPNTVLTWDALSALGNLTELQNLSFGRFYLPEGLPPEMTNLSRLEGLGINYSRLDNGIPPVLSRMRNLRELYILNSELTGEIPVELGNMSSLKTLDLRHNDLTGGIPPALADLANLRKLSLSGNKLSGELPPELFSMESLRILEISGNQFTGEIPPDLDEVLRRMELRITGNNFTGCVSDALNELGLELPVCDVTHQGDLETIIAIHKALGSPNLDSWLSRAPLHEWSGISTDREGRVVKLLLDESRRSSGGASIPEEVSRLANLEVLRLSENNFSGNIPESLGNLRNLRELRLWNNFLTGDIPASFANLKELRVLSLGHNRMTITLPGPLADLDKLGTGTSFWENQFVGCMPKNMPSAYGAPGCP